MSDRMRKLIVAIAVAQIILIAGLVVLPVAAEVVPGRYRVYITEQYPRLGKITEGVINRVAPVATALPAPAQDAGQAVEVDITSLIAAVPTAEPTEKAAPETQPSPTPGRLSQDASSPAVSPTAALVPSPTPVPTMTPTPEPLPTRVVLEGLGVVRQTFNNCGPANLTQVLNFLGHDITQAQVASYLKPNYEDRNVSPWQIADYVNEQTPLRAEAYSGGTLEMIKRLVAAGFPVVVEKGYQLPESGWWGHYLTIFGYDDGLKEFYSQDSFLGPWDASGRVDSYDTMEFYWEQFNYTFYVVYQPEQEAAVQAILGPVMLDPLKMWNNAANRADQERQENPENMFAWFNLGTSLTRLGELTGEQEYYHAGAQAFDQARKLNLPPRMLWYQHRIYTAYQKVGRFDDVIALANATLETQGGRNVEETYWYKGHALLALGDVAGAKRAYQAALAVNKNFYPAQWSLDYVASLSG